MLAFAAQTWYKCRMAKIKIDFRIDKWMLDAIKKIAKPYGATDSDIIRALIGCELKRRGFKCPKQF